MIDPASLHEGSRVHYDPGYGEPENGVVKSFADEINYVFVVYKCAGNWDRYQDYTGQRTHVKDLKHGWK